MCELLEINLILTPAERDHLLIMTTYHRRFSPSYESLADAVMNAEPQKLSGEKT